MHSRNSGKNTKKRLSDWRGAHMGGSHPPKSFINAILKALK